MSQRYAYVNDPLSGDKQRRVSHQVLKRSWEALGRQAITYRWQHGQPGKGKPQKTAWHGEMPCAVVTRCS